MASKVTPITTPPHIEAKWKLQRPNDSYIDYTQRGKSNDLCKRTIQTLNYGFEVGIQTHRFQLEHFRFLSPMDFVPLLPRENFEGTKQRRHVQFGKLILDMKNYGENVKKSVRFGSQTQEFSTFNSTIWYENHSPFRQLSKDAISYWNFVIHDIRRQIWCVNVNKKRRRITMNFALVSKQNNNMWQVEWSNLGCGLSPHNKQWHYKHNIIISEMFFNLLKRFMLRWLCLPVAFLSKDSPVEICCSKHHHCWSHETCKLWLRKINHAILFILLSLHIIICIQTISLTEAHIYIYVSIVGKLYCIWLFFISLPLSIIVKL